MRMPSLSLILLILCAYSTKADLRDDEIAEWRNERAAQTTLNPKVVASIYNQLSHMIETIKHQIGHITLHGNATDHWCCNVATTKKIVQSHSTMIYTKQVKDRVTTHACGFLWLSRCARHHYYYISVPAYKTTYTTRTIHTTCPSKNLVCCKGYILLADNCIPLSELPNIKQDLINLHNANIPVGK